MANQAVKSLASMLAEKDHKAVDVAIADFGAMTVTASRTLEPYVVFAQPKASEQWTQLATKIVGLQDGDPVLVWPDSRPPQKLSPMRFTMIACQQYWLAIDGAGKAKLDAQNRPVPPSLEPKPRADGWKEEVSAACILYLPVDGGLEAVPVSAGFKTVKCGAATAMKQAIEDAAKPEWAENGPAHKAAFAYFSKPFLRVVGTVTMGARTGRTGFSYVPARVTVAPASPAEALALKRLMEEDGGMAKLKALSQHYHNRLKELGVEK